MLGILTGLNLFSSDEIDIQGRLLKCGILFPVHDVPKKIHDILDTFEWQHNFGAQGHTLKFRNAAYNKVFVDIVHVVITKDRTSCTCAPFLMYPFFQLPRKKRTATWKCGNAKET